MKQNEPDTRKIFALFFFVMLEENENTGWKELETRIEYNRSNEKAVVTFIFCYSINPRYERASEREREKTNQISFNDQNEMKKREFFFLPFVWLYTSLIHSMFLFCLLSVEFEQEEEQPVLVVESMVDWYSTLHIDISVSFHLASKSTTSRNTRCHLSNRIDLFLLEMNTSMIHQQTSFLRHYRILHNN